MISGVNMILARPERNLLVPPDADGQRALMFDNNERGERNYDKYEKRNNALKAGEKKMLFSLLAAMNKDVKNALTTNQGYQKLMIRLTFLAFGTWLSKRSWDKERFPFIRLSRDYLSLCKTMATLRTRRGLRSWL